jgi:transcriptional regulator GlxA family with amidase domain
VTPARVALLIAQRHLVERVHQIDETEQQRCSAEFVAVAQALALVVGQLRADPGEMLTTQEMAERYNVSPKTLRKRAAAGTIAAPVRLAKRGASALRWRAQA